MKKTLVILAVSACSLLLSLPLSAAKPVQDTVVFHTHMHCKDCVNKVKENLSFVKGVKDLEVSLEKQRITVVFNPEKNTAERFAEIIRKLGYPAEAVKKGAR